VIEKTVTFILKTPFPGILILLVMLFASQESKAQGERKIIQLSGIILSEEDTTSGMPGVHIYVPSAGRGTTSNRVGYFSMPVLEGDEIVISAIGFEKKYYKIPDMDKDNITIIVELQTDVTYLDEVEIMPFPTEEVLKEAVIALNLPVSEGVNDENLNENLLRLMIQSTPMDASLNSSWYLNNWVEYQNDNFGPRPNPLLNPFNWAKFFKSLKKKD
jgi:hypothetical protein